MVARKAKTLKTPSKPNDNIAYASDVLVALLTDGFNSLPRYSVADYRADVESLLTRIRCEGLYFVVKVLPDLIQTVFDRLEGRTAAFSGFATRNDVPIFLGHIISQAIAGESVYIRFLYQFCVCFKKTEDAFLGDKRMEERRMWQEYKATDDELRSIDWFAPKNEVILERARHYAQMFCKGLDLHSQDNVPRPGPGGTRTKRPAYERYVPFVKYAQLDRVFSYEQWFYSRPSLLTDRAREYLGLQTREEAPRSRYKAVPKTATKLRGICLEENEVQYLQQGVRRALTKHIKRHPLYRRRIVLHDQSVNGWMAMAASISLSFATIDMKEASDRIARELVSWLFQNDRKTHDILMALSTRFVSPPIGVKEEDFATAKFAPMGSAVCFPVMSLVFMFLIRAAISTSKLPNPHFLSTNVFVYGDDIVIPSIAYDIVTECLQNFGLLVNLTKSYVKSAFRESCGVHAYAGMDVTPVYARKFPKRSQLTSLRSLIETEYQFHKKGYYCTSEVLQGYGSLLWRKYLANPLYVVPESSILGWKRDPSMAVYRPVVFKDGRKQKIMVDSDFQRTLIRGVVLTSQEPNCSLIHGSEAMLRWIALKPKEEQDESTLAGDCAGFDQLKTRAKWEPSEHVLNAVLPPPKTYFTTGLRAVN